MALGTLIGAHSQSFPERGPHQCQLNNVAVNSSYIEHPYDGSIPQS